MASVSTQISTPRRDAGGGKAPSRLRLVVTRRIGRGRRISPTHRLAFFAAAVIVGVCLLVVVAQAIVASRQIRIDNLEQGLASSVSTNERLQVDRATLLAPTRILSIAEHKLGMVSPAKVTYLVPVSLDAVPPASKVPAK